MNKQPWMMSVLEIENSKFWSIGVESVSNFTLRKVLRYQLMCWFGNEEEFATPLQIKTNIESMLKLLGETVI